MHGYSGNPANWPGAVDLGDDSSDPPTFLTWNIGFEGCLDRTAYLYRLQQTPVFLPLGAQLPVLPNGFYQAGCWDPVACKWIVAGLDSGSHLALCAGRTDVNSGWNALGAASSLTDYVANSVCRGAGTYSNLVAVGVAAEGSPAIHIPSVAIFNVTSNTWSGAAVVGGVSDAASVVVMANGSTLVAAVGTSSTVSASWLFYSTNGGGTWTRVTGSGSVTVGRWQLAQESVGAAGLMLAIQQTVNVSSFLFSTDGITWNTSGGLSLPSTAAPSGLVYGVDGEGVACWILTCLDSVTLSTTTYRSYDGLAFTAFTNNLPAGLSILFLAAAGNLLCATVAQDTGDCRILYSADGGSTWQVSNGTVLSLSNSGVLGGPVGFLGWSPTCVVPSTWMGSPGGLGTT